ncbi:MAG: HEAT repeat domain-containing protein, partial [Planctomycetaceae bacterium]
MIVVGAALAVNACADESRAATKAEIDTAVERAIEFLRKYAREGSHGTPSLGAYALIKAGYPASSLEVTAILEDIKKKVKGGVYTPRSQQYYEAGVDLMALEAAAHDLDEKGRFSAEMQAITTYILEGQDEGGSWYYPNSPGNKGDTSITQYALLGLWAASRGGIKIPPGTWERAALWHLRTQAPAGHFTYHPGADAAQSRHAMTVNGVASLCIARLFLYPNGDYALPTPDQFPAHIVPPMQPVRNRELGWSVEQAAKAAAKSAEKTGNGATAGNADDAAKKNADSTPEKPKRKFGILERVNLSTGKRDGVQTDKAAVAAKGGKSLRASVPLGDINLGIARGVEWMNINFTITRPDGWPTYYLYGLERMSALASIEDYKGRQWYAEGADHLVERQGQDGTFPVRLNKVEGTSFGLLFLTNATSKLIGPSGTVSRRLGAGLLIGNRGLPENLSEINATGDGVKKRKMTGPVDELLAELENAKSLNVEAAQAAIVEQVQLGDRESLVGQRDRLLKLVQDPRVEVRRTATWALSRCGKIDDAAAFIKILGEDPDLSVAIEANNALCWLSRRPGGVSPKTDPFDGLDESADEKTRTDAATKWRQDVLKKWKEWFATVQS